MKNKLTLLLPLVFGIPFLLMTDLFPLHRYGMFASLPGNPSIKRKYEIEIFLKGSWQVLTSGNEYLDHGYFPVQAEEGFRNKEAGEVLARKVLFSLRESPDSIRLILHQPNKPDSIQCLYPVK